jgi:CheY-like chemotaxis protein
MPTRVLIVDTNEAFAMLLKEGLEADREFRGVDVSSSRLALSALQSDAFDLAIVDLGIDDMEPLALLRAMRDLRPELPIMIIPLDGDIVPQDLVPFNIKGVLTKPFFLPELPVRVAEALGRPLPEPAPMPEAAPAGDTVPAPKLKAPVRTLPRIALPKDDPRVTDALRVLVEALDAEAALLIAGNALLAHFGPLDRSGAETLANRILDSRASPKSRWIVPSHEQLRFGQSISDSGEHLLYSVDVAQSVLLTVAVRPDASLRAVRAHTRQTADALVALGS